MGFWAKTTLGRNFPLVSQIQSKAFLLSFLDYLGFSTIALEIHSFDTDWNEVLIRYLRGSFNLLTKHLGPNKPCVNQIRVFTFACTWDISKLPQSSILMTISQLNPFRKYLFKNMLK